MINFDPTTHTYTNKEGVVYSSASQLIGLYKEPFDVEFFSRMTAKKRGVSPEVIKEEWRKNTESACDFGKIIHSNIEQLLKEGSSSDDILIQEFVKVFPYKTGIKSEVLLWNHEAKIAGTSDIIVDINDNYFDVLDLKTNKKFDHYNKYNKYLLKPLDHLQDCKYNTYSLQLSLYAYMYSKITGKKPRQLVILYWNRTTFERFHSPYMFWEVSVLLKHFNQPALQ